MEVFHWCPLDSPAFPTCFFEPCEFSAKHFTAFAFFLFSFVRYSPKRSMFDYLGFSPRIPRCFVSKAFCRSVQPALPFLLPTVFIPAFRFSVFGKVLLFSGVSRPPSASFPLFWNAAYFRPRIVCSNGLLRIFVCSLLLCLYYTRAGSVCQ